MSSKRLKSDRHEAQLEADLVRSRAQIFELNYKVTALKDKLKKAKDEIRTKNLQIDELTASKAEMNANYCMIMEKLQKREELVAQRHQEILERMK